MNRDNILGYILPSLMWTAVITLVLVQMAKPGKAVQAVEHWPVEASTYYGERDTTTTRWVCCRVIR